MLKAKKKGSAQDNTNLGTFEKETFLFPPPDKQKEITSNFDELSSTVSSLEAIYQQELNALAELKQPLPNKALFDEMTARRWLLSIYRLPILAPGRDHHLGKVEPRNRPD